VDIQNKEGQYFNVTHNLNSTEVLVDITGKRTLASGEHRINFGLREVSTPEWSKTYGGTNHDGCYYVIQTSDGGHALAGSTASYGVGAPPYLNAWLVKTDSAGNAVWNKTYGGTRNDYAYAMVQTGDGGYALAGSTSSYGVGTPSYENFWLVKTDSAGNALWNQTYGGTNYDYCFSVAQAIDGGYALAGWTRSYGVGAPSYNNFYFVKTDSVGNQMSNQTYGGANLDYCYSAAQTNDGGYALAGLTYSYGAGAPSYSDVYLVKTEGVASGLVWVDSTNNTVTLYRGTTDTDWKYVRVRIWLIKEPTWIYGDINMDGVVDAKDLYILGRNYGKTFSLLSLTGIIAIAGIRTVKKRKQTKQPSYIN
jgi:hypothetical protein